MRTFLIVVAVVVIVALIIATGFWFVNRRPSAPAPPSAPPATEQAPSTPTPPPPAKQPQAPTFQVKHDQTALDLAGATRVIIDNRFGNVHVQAGGSRVTVEENVYARGSDKSAATARAKPFRVTTKRTAGELGITVAGDAKDTDVGLSLVVTLPPTTPVQVHVLDGDVRVEDFRADVGVDGAAGNISIGAVQGKVTASATAGDITITHAAAGLEANASSGAVTAEADGAVVTRTMGGAITLRVGRSTSVRASTMSAPIDLTVTAPFSGQLEATSASGDITVALPPTSNCHFRASTGTGPISYTLPLVGVKRAGPNIDEGRLGAGKGFVKVMNDTGGIKLVPAKK